MTGAVDLSPIVKTIEVRRAAGDAFRLFTEDINAWWPIETHSLAKAELGQKAVAVAIEGRIGGRVYERLASGEELDWGMVTAFDPGHLFAMRWQLGHPDDEVSDVSVRFEPTGSKSCRVTLTHAGWNRMGEKAAKRRDGYAGGWATVFEQRYGDYANASEGGE